MGVCYTIYHKGSGECMELGKCVGGQVYQRDADAIVRFVAERVRDGSEFRILGDAGDPPPGEWKEVLADIWPGTESDPNDLETDT